jgi:hypothetical protein
MYKQQQQHLLLAVATPTAAVSAVAKLLLPVLLPVPYAAAHPV